MINKKFSLMFAAGILSLAACGQEQPVSEEETQPTEEQESADTEETATEEPMEEDAEGMDAEEDDSEEEPAEDDAESAQESAPEAMSGSASELLANGESTSFVFNETGEYSIFCAPHPVMKMTVIVEEGAEAMDKVSVDIADYEFGEETITVAPGTTIEWTNQDQVQHNVAFK